MNHEHSHSMEHHHHDHPAKEAERKRHEHTQAGHGGHSADHTGHEAMFRKRFWVSLVLSVPVLLFSEMLQSWLGFSMPSFSGSDWIGPLFAVVIFIYGGIPFLQMAVPELKNRKPGMMTLISLAISVAFVYSVSNLFLRLGSTFFWELVTLIDVMLLGHWMEMRSVRQASGALGELAKLMPDTAERIVHNGHTETVAVADLRDGDTVLVRPGGSVPADGKIVGGQSDVNEAMITGESRPVVKKSGDAVIGGTVNGDGSLRVRITATGENTALAGIMRLVKQAQQSKSRTQLLADKAAAWLFYVAIGVALATAVGWTSAMGLSLDVLKRVVTVLVIACPHALGLAIPLVVALSTSISARNGILVRDRLALEVARKVDTVIFDKTGTLTRGEQGVVAIAAIDGWSGDDALALTAAIESDSEHVMARGIRKAASEKSLSLPTVTNFEAIKGHGVKASHNGQTVHVGGPNLLKKLGTELPETLANFTEKAGREGKAVVYLLENGSPKAGLALADVVRRESAQAVHRLHELGIKVAMLTGDSKEVAEAVANELGIDTFFAEVLPDQKDKTVADLQGEGKVVAMVGDGVNDAPALTRADIGIAIGGGTDVAIESAGIILVRSNPLDVVKVIELSRASYRKMTENLIWATGYNVIALPLAAGVLAPLGILLSPAIGALLMSLSTVIVALNAQLLRRVRLSSTVDASGR